MIITRCCNNIRVMKTLDATRVGKVVRDVCAVSCRCICRCGITTVVLVHIARGCTAVIICISCGIVLRRHIPNRRRTFWGLGRLFLQGIIVDVVLEVLRHSHQRHRYECQGHQSAQEIVVLHHACSFLIVDILLNCIVDVFSSSS